MEEKLQQQLDYLLEKYTELLLGETNPDVKEEVRQWILYTHIAKACLRSSNIGINPTRTPKRASKLRYSTLNSSMKHTETIKSFRHQREVPEAFAEKESIKAPFNS